VEVAVDKVSVLTTFRDEPIEMYPDEAESLKQQGLIREPPAAETAKPAAKQEAAKDAAAK
jgi:hypothetical protein